MSGLVPPVPAPRTLVVRLPNPAGDAVLSTPALRGLRRALPATRIVWAGKASVLALLDGLPDRDATLPVEGPLARGLEAPWRLGRAYRALGADAVLLLSNSLGTALGAAASRARVRAGYAKHGRRPLLTHVLAQPCEGGSVRPEPMRTAYLRLAALFGAEDDGQPARLVVTREGTDRAAARVERDRIPVGCFAVSPGAGYGPSKCYPPRLLADAVRRVRTQTGLTPMILVGPGEEDLGADVARRVGPPLVSTHADVARWPEAKALLRHADLLIAPDAGPRHVAAALGTPVVCLVGPTDPRWGQGDEALVTVVRRDDLECLGCHLRTCPIGHPCMRRLDPAVVAAACVRRLAAVLSPPSPPSASPSPPGTLPAS